MSHTRTLTTNTLWQVVGKIITAGSTLLVTILIARSIGTTGYGEFTTIVAVISPFLVLSDFGFNATLLREDTTSQRIINLLILRLLWTTGLMGIAVLFYFGFLFFQHTISPILLFGFFLYATTLITTGIVLTAAAVFQRHLKYWQLTITNGIGSLVTLGIIFVFSQFSLPLFWVLVSFCLGGIFSALIALLFIKKELAGQQINKIFIQQLVAQSLPLGLMLFCNLIYFRADMVLLSVMKPASDVGIYGFSYRIFDFIIALPLFLSNVLYPTLTAERKNKRIVSSLVAKFSLVFVGLAVFFTIVFWFVPSFFGLVNNGFIESSLPFRILLISLPFFFLTNFYQWFLISQKEQRYLLFVYVFCAILNVALNFVFIPTFSYNAAAAITGISEAIVLVFLVLRVKYVFQNFPELKG